MERNDSKKLKITAGLVAAAVVGLTMQAEGSRGGQLSAAGAERALVYGTVDATWVQRATQLIAADPAVATEIGRIAGSSSVDGVRRGRAFDALAQAGSDAAETAMREALASVAVQADPTYPMLLVRLGQLSAPGTATLAFVSNVRARAFSDGNGELAFAAQQTLDAAYGHRLAALYQGSARHARSFPSLTGAHRRGE